MTLLTISEVAVLMRVSTDTVYRLAQAGKLPGRKVGRCWRFPSHAIHAYLLTRHGACSEGSEPRQPNAQTDPTCTGCEAGDRAARPESTRLLKTGDPP